MIAIIRISPSTRQFDATAVSSARARASGASSLHSALPADIVRVDAWRTAPRTAQHWYAEQAGGPRRSGVIGGATAGEIESGLKPAQSEKGRQIENDIPQPHVVAAFGLLITNRDPCRSSL